MDEPDLNKPKKPLAKKIMRFSGVTFIAIGALTLMGWMQNRDPDCTLAETEDSLNFLRMCETASRNVKPDIWWPLAAGVIAIILGLVVIRLSNKK